MNDHPLFDYAESIRHRDNGMHLAAEHAGSLLIHAREVAVRVATVLGEVTADDVMREMVREGYSVHCLGNGAGRLFAGDPRFISTGRYKKSVRIHAHGNPILVWRLK